MMQTENQTLNVPTGDAFLAKAEPQMNSQGEIITPSEQTLSTESSQLSTDNFDDVISLADTELAIKADALCPATDDTGMEHKIISFGHVLKSTHDLARWSEKTGARRVNSIESLDAVSDLAINLEPNKTARANGPVSAEPSEDISRLYNEGGKGSSRRGKGAKQWRPVEGLKSEVINCWPVLKSTHDQAQLSEKRGRNAVNQAGASAALEELAVNPGQGGQQKRGQQKRGGKQQGSTIIQSWPVLKSTHDLATLDEKSGANAVNQSAAALDEIAGGQVQAGGSSLQSGLDTQAGSHVQLDSTQKLTEETPEKVMESLHVHV